MRCNQRNSIPIGHSGGLALDRLTVTVAEAQRLTGLGATTIWKLGADKKVEFVRVGRRTLITFASLQRLLTPRADDSEAVRERSAAARRLRAKRLHREQTKAMAR
jgi:excisionase family DNA binding protein